MLDEELEKVKERPRKKYDPRYECDTEHIGEVLHEFFPDLFNEQGKIVDGGSLW